jgi:hypothetical protein
VSAMILAFHCLCRPEGLDREGGYFADAWQQMARYRGCQRVDPFLDLASTAEMF